MKSFRSILQVAALLSLLPAGAGAEEATFDLGNRVVEHTLPNGMRWLIVRRPGAPVFSAYLRILAGGMDEEPHRTGVAHLLEHMAFKGTTRIGTRDYAREAPLLEEMDRIGEEFAALQSREPTLSQADRRKAEELKSAMEELRRRHMDVVVKDEFVRLLSAHGAENLNASTSQDLTTYHVSLPANCLELWALLEASRLADPVLREFWSEKDVVMEERRMRVEDSPDGKLYETLLRTAFGEDHPYGNPTVGSWEDLRRLTRRDAEDFWRRNYGPANVVGALVGDLEPEAVKEVLDRYFGVLPSRPASPRRTGAGEAVLLPGGTERRVEVEFPASPLVMIGFRKPALPHRHDHVFDVVDGLLASGRSSRLHRALVQRKQVASQVFTFTAPGSRLPNLFVVGAVPRHPHTAAEVEAAILEELEELTRKEVPAKELEKVKRNLRADFLRGLKTNEGLASELSYFQAVAGDWRYVVRHPGVIATITGEEVRQVARTYFRKENRVVATLVERPAPAVEGGEEGTGKEGNDGG